MLLDKSISFSQLLVQLEATKSTSQNWTYREEDFGFFGRGCKEERRPRLSSDHLQKHLAVFHGKARSGALSPHKEGGTTHKYRANCVFTGIYTCRTVYVYIYVSISINASQCTCLMGSVLAAQVWCHRVGL